MRAFGAEVSGLVSMLADQCEDFSFNEYDEETVIVSSESLTN